MTENDENRTEDEKLLKEIDKIITEVRSENDAQYEALGVEADIKSLGQLAGLIVKKYWNSLNDKSLFSLINIRNKIVSEIYAKTAESWGEILVIDANSGVKNDGK
jgi:hypothetical protein